MVDLIGSLHEIADAFDAVVFDQWGVLHDGSAAYPRAQEAIARLDGPKIGVLSNSGKRAAPNLERIAGMGFDADVFHTVMTSGEALWHSFATEEVMAKRVFAIEGKAGDAQVWADGLNIEITSDINGSEAVLLMGLPDGSRPEDHEETLSTAYALGLPMLCSNPDLTSPRGGATYVMSPGVLAADYAARGGKVTLFGKPHLPVFAAMQDALDCAPDRILMVGDSLHHDIAGAHNAGWKSLLIEGGVHQPHIGADRITDIRALARKAHTAPPHYALPDLR